VTRRFAPFLLAPLFAVSAHAGSKVLVSAPIANAAGGISCLISNGGSDSVTVTSVLIEGVSGVSTMLNSPLVVAPTNNWMWSNRDTVGHCSITVKGSTRSARAVACRWEGEDGEIGTTSDCIEMR
jgi:hypothetical protein